MGERVDIDAGEIEVLDFIRFLADYTGLPVIVDSSNQQALKNMITIASRMNDVSGEIVTAILQANRFLVSRRVLPSGDEILSIEPAQAAVPVPDEPQETPLLMVRDGSASMIDTKVNAELQSIRPDEIATMVFTLKYTQPADAITSLNSLISGGAGKGTGRSKAFSIVDVKNSMLVIITAKFGLLNYLQKLLTIIDVPVKEAERIIQIIDVENADADELTQLIMQVLQGRGGAGGGRLGARPQPAVPQPGQPGQPITTGVRQGELQTNLIADWRTQKIIIETYNEKDLEDIFLLVRELDTRYDIRRLKTRIYQVRYLKADEVAADLQQVIGGSSFGLSGRAGLGTRTGQTGGRAGGRAAGGIPRRGGAPGGGIPTPTPGVPGGQQGGGQNAPMPALIVPHIQTNSLIIQAEPEEYAEVLNILGQIDVKRRQVFLEAALVGSPPRASSTGRSARWRAQRQALRLLRLLLRALGIDTENFNRAIGPVEPDVPRSPARRDEPGQVPASSSSSRRTRTARSSPRPSSGRRQPDERDRRHRDQVRPADERVGPIRSHDDIERGGGRGNHARADAHDQLQKRRLPRVEPRGVAVPGGRDAAGPPAEDDEHHHLRRDDPGRGDLRRRRPDPREQVEGRLEGPIVGTSHHRALRSESPPSRLEPTSIRAHVLTHPSSATASASRIRP